MDAPTTIPLPCPLSAGWEVVEQRLIEPSQGGGFSAGAYRPEVDQLWLLSDAQSGSISRWRGLRAGGLKGLIQLPPLPLKQPEPMNEEGLVVEGQHFWEASEGKQHPAQRAALLRSDMAAGSLLSSQELPPDWRLQPDRGLRSNGGPESLSRLHVDGALLMAAEKPLLQDPPDCVRLLRWKLDTSGALHPAELSPLALPPGGWGLADLLARLLPKPWASGPADRCVNSSYCRIAPLAARYKLRPARGWLSAIAACCRRSSVVG